LRYQFVEANRSTWPILVMCKTLKVNRSGYYAWQKRPISTREQENTMLAKTIKEHFDSHKQRYGSPRIHNALIKKGIPCGLNRVARLMHTNGLAAHGKRKFRVTTDSRHSHSVHPNLLNRNFTTAATNQVWTGDITYIRTFEGRLYLAVVIDLFSRKVIGWAMDSRINAELVATALRMAISARKPKPGIIFHSDRGSQYAGLLFQRIIKGFQFLPSMSRKGDCWDNAPTENFFATLKKELIRNLVYNNRNDAMGDIFYYIESYYNISRSHSTLGYNSPTEFENLVA